MSFLSSASKRRSATMTGGRKRSKTTMIFDEFESDKYDAFPRPPSNTISFDGLDLTTNILHWITTGSAEYINFEITMFEINNTVTFNTTLLSQNVGTLLTNTRYEISIKGTTSFGEFVYTSQSLELLTPHTPPTSFTVNATNILFTSFDINHSYDLGIDCILVSDSITSILKDDTGLTIPIDSVLSSNRIYTIDSSLLYRVRGLPDDEYPMNAFTSFRTDFIRPTIVINQSTSQATKNSITIDYVITWGDADDDATRVVSSDGNTLSSFTSYPREGLQSNTEYTTQICLSYKINTESQTSICDTFTATTDHEPPTISIGTITTTINTINVAYVINWQNADSEGQSVNATNITTSLTEVATETSHLFNGLSSNTLYNLSITLNYSVREYVQTSIVEPRNVYTYHVIPTLQVTNGTAGLYSVPVTFNTTWGDAVDDATRKITVLLDGDTIELSGDATGHIFEGLDAGTTFSPTYDMFYTIQTNSTNTFDIIDVTKAITTEPHVEPDVSQITEVSKTETSIIMTIAMGGDGTYTPSSTSHTLTSSPVSTITYNTSNSQYTASGLSSGTQYIFTSTKYYTNHDDVVSSPKTIRPLQPIVSASITVAPTLSSQTNGLPAVLVSYTINSWGGYNITDVILEYTYSSDTTFSSPIGNKVLDTSGSYMQLNLSSSTEYRFRIRKGSDVYSSTPTATTYDMPQLPVLDTTNLVRTYTQIRPSFSAGENNGHTQVSLKILYSTSTNNYSTTNNYFNGLQNTNYSIQIKKTTSLLIGSLTYTIESLSAVTLTNISMFKNVTVLPTIQYVSTTQETMTFKIVLGSYETSTPTATEIYFNPSPLIPSTQYTTIDPTTITEQEFTINSLTSNTAYSFIVKKRYSINIGTDDVVNGFQYSVASISQSTLKDMYLPHTIVSVDAVADDDSQATLTWTTGDNGDYFNAIQSQVFSKIGSGAEVERSGFLPNTQQSFALTGLAGSTTYSIIVRRKSGGSGAVAVDSSIWFTTNAIIEPAIPSITSSTPTTDQIVVNWSEGLNYSADNVTYKIVYQIGTQTPFTDTIESSPHTIEGLSADTSYKIKIQKLYDIDGVSARQSKFSTPEHTQKTEAPTATMPTPPEINLATCSWSGSTFTIPYKPKSHGTAVTVAIVGYYAVWDGTEWGSWIQIYTEDGLLYSPEIERDYVRFTGFTSNGMYALQIAKETDLSTTSATVVVDKQASSGGSDDDSFVPFGWWMSFPPPSNNPTDPDDNPEIPDIYATSTYKFSGGSLNNTGTLGISNIDFLPLNPASGAVSSWYLDDANTQKLYLNNGFTVQMSNASLTALHLTNLLNFTVNIVIHSVSDVWVLKHNNIIITSTATDIKLTYSNGFDRTFTYTKSSSLFNDLTFVVDSSINLISFYENNILIDTQSILATASYFSTRWIELQTSTDTIISEFTILFGYCRTMGDISMNYTQKWSNGFDFHLVTVNTVTSVLDATNTFTTTHLLEMTCSPSTWISSVDMKRDDETYTTITGSSGVFSRDYTQSAIGSTVSATSTLNSLAITELTRVFKVRLTMPVYTDEVLLSSLQINDPSNPHVYSSAIHPTITSEVECNSINNFIIRYYANTNANGYYSVIKKLKGYIIEEFDSLVEEFDVTLTTPVYGNRVLFASNTMTNSMYRNFFEPFNNVTQQRRYLQNGLVEYMLKPNNSNAITQNVKILNLRILPHPVQLLTYNGTTKVYTLDITIDDLYGNETTATLLLDFTTGLSDVTFTYFTDSSNSSSISGRYATVSIPNTITFPTSTQSLVTMTFKKANRRELFDSTPALSRLTLISSTPRTNLYAYVEPWTDIKEYNFKVVFSNEVDASGVDYLRATIVLEKSNAQLTSYQIDITYTAGSFSNTGIEIISDYENASNTATQLTYSRSGSAGVDSSATLTLGYLKLYPQTSIVESDINFEMTVYSESLGNFIKNTVFVKEGFDWSTTYELSVVTDIVSSTHIRGLSTLTKDIQNLVSVVIDVVYDSSVVTFDSVTLSSFSLFYYSPAVTTPSAGTKRITITTSNPNNALETLSLIEFKWIPVTTRRTHIDKNDITYTLVSASHGTNANPVTATVENVVAQNTFTLLCDMELKATVSTVLKSSTTEKSKMTFECSLDVFPDADITEFSINITYPIASVTNTTTLTTQQQSYISVTSSTDTTGLLAIKTYTFSGIFEYEDYTSTLEPITFHMSQKYLSSAFTQSDIVIELMSFTYYWDIHNLNLITPCLITENTDTYPAPYYRDITPIFFPTISLDGMTLKIAHDSLIPNPTTLNISTTAKVSVPNPTLELTSGTTSEITVTPSSLDAYGGDSLSYIDMTNFTASYSYSTGIRFGLQIIGTGQNYIPSYIKVIFFPQTIPQTGLGEVKIDICVSKEHLPWTNIKYLKIAITQNSACLFTSFAPTQSARTTYTTGSSPEILYQNNLSSNSLQAYSLSIPDVYYLGQAVFNLTDTTQPIEDWFPTFQLPSTLSKIFPVEMTDTAQIYNFSIIQPTQPAYSRSITLKTQFYTYSQFYFQVKCSIDVGDNGLSGLHQLYVQYPTGFWESGLAILGRTFGENCSLSVTQTDTRLTINYEDTKTVKTSGLTQVVEFLLKYPGSSYYDTYARNFIYFQTLQGFGDFVKVRTFDTAQFSLGVSATNMVVNFIALANGRPANGGNGSVEKIVFQDVNGNSQSVEELTYINRKFMNTGQADMTNSTLLRRVENFSKRHLWYGIPFIAFDSDPFFLGQMVYSFLVPATVRRIAIKFRNNNEIIGFKYSSPISRFTEVNPYGTSGDGWTEEFLVMNPTPSPSNPDDPLYVDPSDPLYNAPI